MAVFKGHKHKVLVRTVKKEWNVSKKNEKQLPSHPSTPLKRTLDWILFDIFFG